MHAITVKNIPPELYTRLKEAAEANRRSINREVIACIEHAVGAHRVDPDALIARARQLREAAAPYPAADDGVTQAKAAGRP
jgi:plasmid stability protein